MANFAKNIGNFAKTLGQKKELTDSKDQGYCELNVSAKSVLHIKYSQITEIGTAEIGTGKSQGI